MRTGVDDDEVFVAVDGHRLGRVDVLGDALVEGAVDGAGGVEVAGAVQQHATVAFVTDDEVRRPIEAKSARLVQLVVARTTTLAANSAHAPTTHSRCSSSPYN